MTGAHDVIEVLLGALPGLRTAWPERTLAVFGSRVRGDAGARSNLDVRVEFERPVTSSAF